MFLFFLLLFSVGLSPFLLFTLEFIKSQVRVDDSDKEQPKARMERSENK